MPIANTTNKIGKKTMFLIAGAIVLVAVILGIFAYNQSIVNKNNAPGVADTNSLNKEVSNPATIPDPVQPIESKLVEQLAPQVNTATPTQTTTTTELKPSKTLAPTTTTTEKPKNTTTAQPQPKNTPNSSPTTSTPKANEPINTPTVPLNEDRGAFDF